jgi:cytochrome c553
VPGSRRSIRASVASSRVSRSPAEEHSATARRANDPNKMMRMVALKMTDAEIKAVSDYIAGLR